MEGFISKLRNFSKLDFQSKQEVINTGRPTPELRGLLQTTGVRNRRETTRSFQKDWYSRKDWLCGCAMKNRLYCFPCLLFSTSETVWTHTGFCDLKNLPRSLDKHERSTAHIQNQISLKTFGTSRSYSLLFSHPILLASDCMFVNLTCESVPPQPQPSLHVTGSSDCQLESANICNICNICNNISIVHSQCQIRKYDC